MKIKITIRPPRGWTLPGCTIWDVRSIDEFVEMFVRGDKLVIDELQVTIRNFVKHNDRIAAFNVENVLMPPELEAEQMCPYRYIRLEIVQAFSSRCAPEGRTAIHNIKTDIIQDDNDSLGKD